MKAKRVENKFVETLHGPKTPEVFGQSLSLSYLRLCRGEEAVAKETEIFFVKVTGIPYSLWIFFLKSFVHIEENMNRFVSDSNKSKFLKMVKKSFKITKII